MSWLNELLSTMGLASPENIPLILVTLDVSQLPMSCLRGLEVPELNEEDIPLD